MRRAAPEGAALPDYVEIAFELESTNSQLYDEVPARAPRVLLAELQTAGRGRRGRQWIAPFGSGLTFSIAWSYAETPADLQALTLAIGVAVASALHELGAAT
jgi:BirA family biotin operon repressor/biotin-[acetyl-CoA-carboxylase] ligase